ncbi:MAG: M24 family metallopeptidase [Treponema sp.]|jgi:Xaa-Pro aminopeptidase|nr:M24 family metallopeptidase [Treponema sp.]
MDHLDKACKFLAGKGINICVLSSHENIVYITGYDVPLPIGFGIDAALGLPQAFAILDVAEKKIKMVALTSLVSGIQNVPDIAVFPYTSFENFVPSSLYKNFYNATDAALNSCRTTKKLIVGIEPNTLPKIIVDRIQILWPKAIFTDAYPDLAEARKTKSITEIILLRKSALAADAAQRTLNEYSKFYGANEFEVWSKCVDAATRICGSPAIVSGELVSGPRCSVPNYPGGPKDRIIEKGDMGIMDFSVRLNGYWCDCCNTVVFGAKPTKHQEFYSNVTKNAFDIMINTIRPGIKCSEVYAVAEKTYKRYAQPIPHYAGHQIGCMVNETPRIVPYDNTVIEENMVFSLEPGCYEGSEGNSGSRTEKMIHVTASGCEALNDFEWGI